MAIKNFKRREIKYLISQEQFQVINAALMEYMILDKYCRKNGSYMIYNLYFDTDNDEIIRRSINKPYYKEKLRLRSYKVPTFSSDTVFLELKKKIDGIVAKRRAVMTYAEAMQFVKSGIRPEAESYLDRQVAEEIADFLQRNPARPKVFISYERIAYFDKENKDFRVSFDRNIITRRSQVNLIDGDFGSELMDGDVYLMEIKLSSQIPLWLCQYLSNMKIYSTGFSKYGTEYKQYIKQNAALRLPGTEEKHKNIYVIDLPKLNYA